jgi:CheY-like chemotaxis protein
MKILIADDDSDDRSLAFTALSELNTGHTVDFVADGQQLIDFLTEGIRKKAELPDLILLDLNMPRKDGRQALREIKSHPQLKKLKVIIFSTSTSEDDKEFTLSLGAAHYIVKPSAYSDLVGIFRTIDEEYSLY